MASRNIKKQEQERADQALPTLSSMLGQEIEDIEKNENEVIFKFSNGYEIYFSSSESFTLSVRKSEEEE